jgi:hypothetical protein
MSKKTIEEKFAELAELEKKKSDAYKKLWAKYDKVKEEYNKKLLDTFNFENKFLRVEMNDEEYAYLYCNDVWKSKSFSSNEPIIKLRGYGFYCVITDWSDSTFCRWDEFFEYDIRISEQFDIKEEISKVTEITQEEFDIQFRKAIAKMLERHSSNLKDINDDTN